MTSRLIVAAAACLTLTVGVLSLTPGEARATKEYARRERKDCTHCHVNKDGGGPRSERGREYEANGHQFGVKSWTDAANRKKYLRSNSAYLATWYGETLRLLDGLEAQEKLPGGLALISAKRDKLKMFPKAWLRAAKRLLKQGKRGQPNAIGRFLVRLESQFPKTAEGKEAIKLLAELAEAAKTKKLVADSRAKEKARGLYLMARMHAGLGEYTAAVDLLESLKEDPLAEALHKDIAKLLADIQTYKGSSAKGTR